MKKIDEYPIVLGPKEVAEILKISTSTAYRYFQVQIIPSVQMGGSRRVARDVFFDWLINSHKETKVRTWTGS